MGVERGGPTAHSKFCMQNSLPRFAVACIQRVTRLVCWDSLKKAVTPRIMRQREYDLNKIYFNKVID
jgi:hypothetical protein